MPSINSVRYTQRIMQTVKSRMCAVSEKVHRLDPPMIGACNNSCLACYLPVKKRALNAFCTACLSSASAAGPRISPTVQRSLGLFLSLTSSCFRAIGLSFVLPSPVLDAVGQVSGLVIFESRPLNCNIVSRY